MTVIDECSYLVEGDVCPNSSSNRSTPPLTIALRTMNEAQVVTLTKSLRLNDGQFIDPDNKDMRCGDDTLGVFVSSECPIERNTDVLIVGQSLYESLSTTLLDLRSLINKSGVSITIANFVHYDDDPEAVPENSQLFVEKMTINRVDFDVSKTYYPYYSFAQVDQSTSQLKLLYAQHIERKFDQIWCNPCPSMCNFQDDFSCSAMFVITFSCV